MPKELSELRANGREVPRLSDETRHVLDFLGKDRERAFSFREISHGVYPPRSSDAYLPFGPVWTLLRDLGLQGTLDNLLRAGQVCQVYEGSACWYHLSS